ncbi:ABC transporter permease [Clostridium peptidivorans]|uniref:ABC transporter permease n=1 Tax=Clostridium peptidivorans TaxID=100174 RepID=UPI000BE30695|nr:ABC transporter permease [Clostridium peptidivorans]
MFNFWVGILEQGLIFGIMALGVYISYKILDFPDLSVDGSFPLGAAVTATALTSGISPAIACMLSLLAGAIAGSITGILHVKLKITNLLSGIIVMTGLYSVNLRIMGKANIPLFNKQTIFTDSNNTLTVILIFVLLTKYILDFFLDTKIGFLLKATGDNPKLITSLGIDKGKIKILGLAISNALVALSGSIMAQYQSFSDVGMGSGIVVMGLAAIILGEALFKKVSALKLTTVAVLGAILYKSSIGVALKLGLEPTDLKLITSLIVVCALGLSQNKIKLKIKRLSLWGGMSNAKNTETF